MMHLQSKSLSLSIKLSWSVVYNIVLYNVLEINIFHNSKSFLLRFICTFVLSKASRAGA